MKRIKGLDSIRFICAVFVLLGHFGLPLPGIFTDPGAHSYMVNSGKLLQLIFNGPAAVIIFFLISGFCIHFPFINAGRIDIGRYYSRRLLRISIPALAAIILCNLTGVLLKYPEYGILWSIICEIIYYLLYPVLFYLRKFMDWKYLVAGCYFISLLVLLLNLDLVREGQNSYIALGLWTWIVGLPCWLLGCMLAENYLKFSVLSTKKIWLLRVFMLGIVLALRIIKFHTNSVLLSNCFTLNIFAFSTFIWLGYEIMFFHTHQPSRVLEKFGKWSYSLYLTHPMLPAIFVLLNLNDVRGYKSLLVLSCFLIAYLFYLIVEKPSHRFSVYVSSRLFSSTIARPL